MIEENKIVFKESRIFHATSSLAKWQQPLMPSFWKKIIEACLIYPSNEANQHRVIDCWFITHLLKLVLPGASEDCFLRSDNKPPPNETTTIITVKTEYNDHPWDHPKQTGCYLEVSWAGFRLVVIERWLSTQIWRLTRTKKISVCFFPINKTTVS
jgi:hypothetical protein